LRETKSRAFYDLPFLLDIEVQARGEGVADHKHKAKRYALKK